MSPWKIAIPVDNDMVTKKHIVGKRAGKLDNITLSTRM